MPHQRECRWVQTVTRKALWAVKSTQLQESQPIVVTKPGVK